jgi:hypothetical protein
MGREFFVPARTLIAVFLLMRTKVHPALGKTSQLIIGGDDVFDRFNSSSIVPRGISRRNLNL